MSIITNQSGHQRRKHSDNYVSKSGGSVEYKGKIINYDSDLASWILNGKQLGSLSYLCKALGLNQETHQIGFYLESKGYVFQTKFE